MVPGIVEIAKSKQELVKFAILFVQLIKAIGLFFMWVIFTESDNSILITSFTTIVVEVIVVIIGRIQHFLDFWPLMTHYFSLLTNYS